MATVSSGSGGLLAGRHVRVDPMGLMIDGEWHPDEDALTDEETGAFERDESHFREFVGQDGSFESAADRYHLYISRACPWAHRTVIVRTLLGLEDAISVDIVDPVRIDDGWTFSPDEPDCTPDTVNGTDYLREVYRLAEPEYTGRVTVPVLWDRNRETIVNNESSEIIAMFDGAFDDVADRDLTLYPDDLPVAETIEQIYEPINNGVYRAGFATAQSAYEEAVTDLFAALDEWNETLARQRYLCGDRLTAADVCLFTTMYRFDEVYHTHFKCNRAHLIDYEYLWGHTRELYQLLGVAGTCNMDHCKRHYYRSHTDLNPRQLVPIGPGPDFQLPHDRDRIGGSPPAALAV